MSVKEHADPREAPEESRYITVLKDVISNTYVKGWNQEARIILGNHLAVFFTIYDNALDGDWSKAKIDDVKKLVGVKTNASPDNIGILDDARKKIKDTGVDSRSLRGVFNTVVTTATMLSLGIETHKEYLDFSRKRAEKNRSAGKIANRFGHPQTSTPFRRRIF